VFVFAASLCCFLCLGAECLLSWLMRTLLIAVRSGRLLCSSLVQCLSCLDSPIFVVTHITLASEHVRTEQRDIFHPLQQHGSW
jgi:membrane protein implicated in regulation of membrane protease activity